MVYVLRSVQVHEMGSFGLEHFSTDTVMLQVLRSKLV